MRYDPDYVFDVSRGDFCRPQYQRAVIFSHTPIIGEFLEKRLREAFTGLEITQADTIAKLEKLVANSDNDLLPLLDCTGMPRDEIKELCSSFPINANSDVVIILDGEMQSFFNARMADRFIPVSPQFNALQTIVRNVISGNHVHPVTEAGNARTSADETGSGFTPREEAVLEKIAKGYRNRQIASELGIKESTVRGYITAIFDKTGIRSKHGIVIEMAKNPITV